MLCSIVMVLLIGRSGIVNWQITALIVGVVCNSYCNGSISQQHWDSTICIIDTCNIAVS